MGKVLPFLFLFFACPAVALGSGSFRCGNEIISVGDSKGKVVARCGSPTSKDLSGTEFTISKGGTRKVSRDLENWYYNCGKNDFLYVLTFRKGVLVSIDSDGYGNGEGHCKGGGK